MQNEPQQETNKVQPLKKVGRPSKPERDRGISIFLDQSRMGRIEALAEEIRARETAAKGNPVGSNAFHSAALRALMDRGWPDPAATSAKGEHQKTNVVVNYYMDRHYLGIMDAFVAQVAATGKLYNRSIAVRDLIDLHLPSE